MTQAAVIRVRIPRRAVRRRRRPPRALIAVLMFAWGLLGLGALWAAIALKTAAPTAIEAASLAVAMLAWSGAGYLFWHLHRHWEMWMTNDRPVTAGLWRASQLVAFEGTVMFAAALALPL